MREPVPKVIPRQCAAIWSGSSCGVRGRVRHRVSGRPGSTVGDPVVAFWPI